MTVIVGLLDSGKVYMGADSGVFSGWDVRPLGDAKIFTNGPFLIGGSGDARTAQLLHYQFVPPAIDGDDIDRFMASTFAEAVRKCFKDAGVGVKDKEDGREKQSNDFLIGFRGHLFLLGTTYYVQRVLDPYEAVGAGERYALGSLASSEGPADERITKALEVAARFSAAVRPPFFIKSI